MTCLDVFCPKTDEFEFGLAKAQWFSKFLFASLLMANNCILEMYEQLLIGNVPNNLEIKCTV